VLVTRSAPIANQIHPQTVLASKGARVAAAARGRKVVDFGAPPDTRRRCGPEGRTRLLYATSNVLAGKLYGIPVAGTIAHSYVQAHDDERDAFRAFARTFPETVLLVDTYDTLAGVRRVIALVKDAPERVQVSAVSSTQGILAPWHARRGRCSMLPACSRSASLRAAASTSTKSAGCSTEAPRSTGSEWAPEWASPMMRRRWTSRTSCPSTAARGAPSCPAHKPILPGRKQVFRQCALPSQVRSLLRSACGWEITRTLVVDV
jgi:nicotinate phosphoribosyltransferase